MSSICHPFGHRFNAFRGIQASGLQHPTLARFIFEIQSGPGTKHFWVYGALNLYTPLVRACIILPFQTCPMLLNIFSFPTLLIYYKYMLHALLTFSVFAFGKPAAKLHNIKKRIPDAKLLEHLGMSRLGYFEHGKESNALINQNIPKYSSRISVKHTS